MASSAAFGAKVAAAISSSLAICAHSLRSAFNFSKLSALNASTRSPRLRSGHCSSDKLAAREIAAASVVRRKLDMIDFAATLNDLSSPPGNRLEALRGDLKGFHSIRVNDQWRIVFRWTPDGPAEVDVRDYH